MKFKSLLVKPIAQVIANRIKKWSKTAVSDQKRIFHTLIKQAEHTEFGKQHDFQNIYDYEDFKERVPIRAYEGLKPFIDRIIEGHSDVLWPKKPFYFAKTSGTTSGVKYIPLTKESMPNHFGTARNALFNYYGKTGRGNWLDGKMIFLSGSPELEQVGSIKTGRLSGIVNHEIPSWLRSSQLPSYSTNCIENWEDKVAKIVEETHDQDLRLISGIPPWVQMYFEQILEKTGKSTIKEVFPNFEIFVYGGVNYAPYQGIMEQLIGAPINSLETYPASEGFIAFQDTKDTDSLLLNTNSGIFFEFVPVAEIFDENPTRLRLNEVKLNENYALILNTNAGLWAYNIGDTIKFSSVNPYRIVVTGRIKHFISAFGEHVIGKEVEKALLPIASKYATPLVEFTVAPQIHPPEGGLPYHEWLIEFENLPTQLEAIAEEVDRAMCQQNIYYNDLRAGKILQRLQIKLLPKGSFRAYMKAKGKLGGQNKVPRLSNDRDIADFLLNNQLEFKMDRQFF